MSGKELYLFYKSHGICVKCGRNSALNNHTLCGECTYKNNERAVRRYGRQTEEQKQAHNAYLRELRHKRKENGICVQCGSRKAMPGKQKCIECSIKAKRYSKKCRMNKMIEGAEDNDRYN